MNTIKSKQRVADHGEVFKSVSLVEAMLVAFDQGFSKVAVMPGIRRLLLMLD